MRWCLIHTASHHLLRNHWQRWACFICPSFPCKDAKNRVPALSSFKSSPVALCLVVSPITCQVFLKVSVPFAKLLPGTNHVVRQQKTAASDCILLWWLSSLCVFSHDISSYHPTPVNTNATFINDISLLQPQYSPVIINPIRKKGWSHTGLLASIKWGNCPQGCLVAGS